MKKSKSVPATFVAAVAAAILAGCGHETEVRRCVDSRGDVVSDAFCEQGPYIAMGCHWIYGGNVSGMTLVGGSRSPSPGFSVITSTGASVTRGGFGAGASMHGTGGA